MPVYASHASAGRVYLVTVTGEIPEPVRMLRECRRVLKPAGKLGISELLTDPDYPLRRTVTAWATSAGFRPAEHHGNFFSYTLSPDVRARPSKRRQPARR